MAQDRQQGPEPAPSVPHDTIREMAGPGPTIQVPRWIQLVVLPVLLLVVFLLARTLGHVLFLFLTASVIAFTLNPLVRDLTRLKVPRAPAVLVVYTIFASVVAALLIAIGSVAFDQARNAADRIDEYVTEEQSSTGQTAAEEDIDRLQLWLDDHGLERVRIRKQVNDWIGSLSAGEVSSYAQRAISFARGAAFSVVAPVLLRDPDRRHLDLHAPRHAAARAGDRRRASRRTAALRSPSGSRGRSGATSRGRRSSRRSSARARESACTSSA